MNTFLQADILGTILKGLLIGIIVSAPMGPVGVLCVQRTLNKGRWYGFVTGVGATCSDLIYGSITGLGMSFVMDLITKPSNLLALKISGSVLLLAFGIYCFRSNPSKRLHISGKNKGTLLYNGMTAFWITLLNPLIVFLFMASFAQMAFIVPDQPWLMLVGYLSIASGALLWWFGLTWLLDKIGGAFNVNTVMLINKVIGSCVVVVSIAILLGTVFNFYIFPPEMDPTRINK